MRVEISNAAAADLTEIWLHGHDQFGIEAADAYGDGLVETIALLDEHPRIGPIHDLIRPPIRSFPHGSHRIFYDVLSDHVLVQRVLHKAMDVERALSSPPY